MFRKDKIIEKRCMFCGKKFLVPLACAATKSCSDECRKGKKTKSVDCPQDSKNSLNDFCKRLTKMNIERETQGLKPLIYGQYVVQNEISKECLQVNDNHISETKQEVIHKLWHGHWVWKGKQSSDEKCT